MPRTNRPRKRRNIRKRLPRRRRPQESRLISSHIFSLQLKGSHKKEEIYPIPLNKLVSRVNIGSDVDIMLRSYSIRIKAASGNNLDTVSANIGMSGKWVERGDSPADTFNQQFVDKPFSAKGAVSFGRSLKTPENHFKNPDIPDNYLNLRIRDCCGVMPGVSLKIHATFRFVRTTIETTFDGADEPAVDKYADQDVQSGSVQPPTAAQDIPLIIKNATSTSTPEYKTSDVASPFKYLPTSGAQDNFVITTAGKANIVGYFRPISSGSSLQSEYSSEGYEGRIVYNSS